MLGQRAPDGDELERRWPPVSGRQRARLALERLAAHAVDARPAADRRERQRDRALGEAVDRHHRLAGRKPQRAKRRAKRSSVAGLTGSAPLSATRHERRGRAPRAPRRRRGARTARRRSWERPRAWPAARGSPTASARAARGTRVGGSSVSGQAVVQAEEPRADQAHVVVERQPARRRTSVGRSSRPRAIARMFASRLVVRKQHALRLAGAARRVLDERGVVGLAVRTRHRTPRAEPARPRSRRRAAWAPSAAAAPRPAARARRSRAARPARPRGSPTAAPRTPRAGRAAAAGRSAPPPRAASRMPKNERRKSSPVGSISATVSPRAMPRSRSPAATAAASSRRRP